MWDDLNARARGLRGRLVEPARLRALAGEPDIAALSRALAGPSRGEVTPTSSARQLDLALRRMAAAQMKLLVRWMGGRTAKLPRLLNALIAGGHAIEVRYTSGHWLDVDSLNDVVRAGEFRARSEGA